MTCQRVVVVLDDRYDQTPCGGIWTQGAHGYSFFARYLEAFDEVRVVARVRSVQSVAKDAQRLDGVGVSVAKIPYYLGLAQYAQKARQVSQAVYSAVAEDDAVILRVPSTMGHMLGLRLARQGRPFAVEVVSDPYDVYGPGATRHPLRPYLRWLFTKRLRFLCQRASACSYVTERALQRRYPPNSEALATHYSSVELPEEAFTSSPREFKDDDSARRWLLVGQMSNFNKGIDVMLDAHAECLRRGFEAMLTIVGDGIHRSGMEARAVELGTNRFVQFRGQLTHGAAVREQIDCSDLFVLPSRHEGLPRALIEAMARGLPAIATDIGGISELLPTDELVEVGSAKSLATKLLDVANAPERLSAMAARNQSKATEFRNEVLRRRRQEFYRGFRSRIGKIVQQRVA